MPDKLKATLLLLTLTGLVHLASGQQPAESPENNTGSTITGSINPIRLYSAGLGVGIFSFYGDIGKGVNNTVKSSFSHFRKGSHLKFERRFGDIIGVSAGFLAGKLSKQERSVDRNLNFETNIYQVDINFVLNFDNDIFMNRQAKFTPVLSAGVGYLFFNPRGDLVNGSGTRYHYWSDGTIQSKPEPDASGQEIQRDYVYETELDSANEYAHAALTLPLHFGLKLKLGDRFDVRIGATYNFTFTDFIDDLEDGNGFLDNDRYLYSHAAIHYSFGGGDHPMVVEKKKEKATYKDFDFTSIDNADTDGDGIADVKDECPDSPKGVKINSKGCPQDTDKDGVPDYRDKEPDSKSGAVVNADGTTMTEEMIAERAGRDTSASLAMDRKTLDAIYERLSEKNIGSSGGSSAIPADLRPGDKNNDGFISSEEITAAIDEFFEGESQLTVDAIYKLIDFFFEQ